MRLFNNGSVGLAATLVLFALSTEVHAEPDMGITDSAGLVLAALGLIVLLLGLHNLSDLRTKTLMPPSYRYRPLRRSRPSGRTED